MERGGIVRTKLACVTALAVALGAQTAQAVDCPTGQSTGPDTAGHCCWPGQAWSNARGVCVGIPASCPDDFEPRGETCAPVSSCPAGQVMSEDTHGHCCWPAQVWSSSRNVCVGVPQCPAGMKASGERCVAPPPVAPSPPPAPPSAPANPNLPRWTPVNPSGGPSPAPSAPPPTSVYVPVEPAPAPASASPPPLPPPPPPPPAVHVPVRFEPRDHSDDRYRITADGKSCTTPCTLELPAGALHVQADAGGRSLAAPLEVPTTPAVVAVSHRSRLHYAVGGALLGVGVVDAALGFWFALGNSFDGHEAVGGVNIALGGVAAIVGIVELALTNRARLEVRAAGTVGSAR